MSIFRTEVKYIQKLTQDILDLKYVTVLEKRKMNGKERNSQQRVREKYYIKSLKPFILEPRNFVEVTILLTDIKKAWLKATLKGIKNLIKNHTFLMDDLEKGDPVTPYIDVYKAKIQSDGNIEKLKLIIVVIGDLNNK